MGLTTETADELLEASEEVRAHLFALLRLLGAEGVLAMKAGARLEEVLERARTERAS